MGLIAGIRDWFTQPVDVEKAKASQPAGSTGVEEFGGYLASGENNAALTGTQKWVTYSNAVNTGIVATGIRYFGNLLCGTEWHCEPNESGDPNAERGAEIVREGLLFAEMTRPWSMVVRKAAMYRLYGFSIHATGVRKRPDGMIVFNSIDHRPQHTIEKWLRADERSPFTDVVQRLRTGGTYEIPLDQCLYAVDDTLTDSPEGVGLLRHVIELVRKLEVYQRLEGLAYQSDMGGMPIGRAPIEELRKASGKTDRAEQNAYIAARTAKLRDILENRIKTPEKLQWWMADSQPFASGQGNETLSSILQWGIELVKSETNGLPDINAVIGRLQFEIARVLGIEFAMVGAEGGSYSMHEDKTSMFATNLQVTLSELGMFATSQLARRLVRLNGLDPDTCTPKLVAEPISTDAIETVTRALANLNMAALAPDDEARNVIRKRLRLPPEPEPNMDLMLPRIPALEPEDDDEDGVEIETDDLADPADKPPEQGASKAATHPLYDSWSQMHQRCTNKSNKDYADYGGRGIKVADRWSGEDGFDNFVADMGKRPSAKHTIERGDNERGYSPGNCEWATMAEQNGNKR